MERKADGEAYVLMVYLYFEKHSLQIYSLKRPFYLRKTTTPLIKIMLKNYYNLCNHILQIEHLIE